MIRFRYDPTMVKGSTFTRTFKLTDNAGLPLNLTDYSVRSQMRQTYTSSAYVNMNASIILPATDGRIQLRVEATVTAALRYTRGVYDIELIYPGSGDVQQIIFGKVKIEPEATR